MNTSIEVAFADKLPPAILENYLDKRAAWYQERLMLRERHSRSDSFDANSHIVLATDGSECVGGMRATVRTSCHGTRLPMEILCPGLRLERIFPELGLEWTPHAELSKLIVHSSQQTLRLGNDIVERLLRHLLLTDNPEPAIPLAFICAPKKQMRIYTMQARTLGVDFDIREVPDEYLTDELRAQAPVYIQVCNLATSRLRDSRGASSRMTH